MGWDLDHFLHFGSLNHLSHFVSEALLNREHADKEAIALLTRWRFNIFKNKAYTESDVYHVSQGEVSFLGRIKNMEEGG